MKKISERVKSLLLSVAIAVSAVQLATAYAQDYDKLFSLDLSKYSESQKIYDSMTNSELITTFGTAKRNFIVSKSGVVSPYIDLNGALSFDNMEKIGINCDKSFSMWINISSSNVNEKTIFSFTKEPTVSSDADTLYKLVYSSVGNKLIWKSAKNINNNSYLEKSVDIVPDIWNHIVVTRCSNGETNNWWDREIYVNGTLLTDKNGEGGLFPTTHTSGAFILGADNQAGSNNCKMKLSYLDIYSARLKDSDALELYNQKKDDFDEAESNNVCAYYNTKEAQPGNTVIVTGDGLNTISDVLFKRLDDDGVEKPYFTEDVRPDRPYGNYSDYDNYVPFSDFSGEMIPTVQSDSQGLKFIIPSSYTLGVYSFKLDNQVMYINKPQIDWIQKTSDNVIRVFGRSLALDKNTVKLALKASDNNIIYLTSKKIYDNYSVEFVLPDDFQNAKYEIYANNNYGGRNAWSEPYNFTFSSTSSAIGSAVYNMKELGAKGDGKTDDSAVFRNALLKSKNSGGGTVYFPRGRYVLTNAFEIPKNTKITGESKSLVNLMWISYNWDLNQMPDSFLYGESNFCVSNITLNASRANCFIKSKTGTSDCGNISIENVSVYSNPFAGIHSNEEISKITNEITNNLYMDAIHIGGSNLEIKGCDIYSPARPFSINGTDNCIIQNNTFYTGFNGWYSIGGADGVIFEDNQIIGSDMTSAGGGVNNIGYQVTENIYFARNSFEKIVGKDREAVTTDGGRGAFYGKISSVSDTIITVDGIPQWGDAYWDNAGVFIICGKGAGQYRRIVSFSGNSIVLDKPFETDPDTDTSKISISSINENGIYIANSFTDTGHLQFYGMSINSVIKDCTFKRSAGINLWGMYVYGAYQPCWYNIIDNNTITEGNYIHWYGKDIWSGMARIRVCTSGSEILNRATVIRNNVIENNGFIELTTADNTSVLRDCVIENNSISLSDTGISASGDIQNVLIRNNIFSDVVTQYDININLLTNDKIFVR